MAFTFSDLNKLNIDSLADVISLTLGLEGELSNGVTVLAGIEKGKPILTFTATDKAVRRSAGCDSEYKYSSLNDKVKYYDHAQIELPIVVCLPARVPVRYLRGCGSDHHPVVKTA